MFPRLRFGLVFFAYAAFVRQNPSGNALRGVPGVGKGSARLPSRNATEGVPYRVCVSRGLCLPGLTSSQNGAGLQETALAFSAGENRIECRRGVRACRVWRAGTRRVLGGRAGRQGSDICHEAGNGIENTRSVQRSGVAFRRCAFSVCALREIRLGSLVPSGRDYEANRRSISPVALVPVARPELGVLAHGQAIGPHLVQQPAGPSSEGIAHV